MKILAIETSCDETAVCILETRGGQKSPRISIFGNALYSQVAVHAEYGGVFPALAKREHQRNLVPLLVKTLKEAGLYRSIVHKDVRRPSKLGRRTSKEHALQKILHREPALLEQLSKFLPTIKKPPIDYIAVTYGPGLEPALWVGINFARALSLIWDVPIIPINHLEGHISSTFLKADEINSKPEARNSKQIQNTNFKIQKIKFPALALLVSGGHTELVLMRDWLKYKVIGETQDDAAGEAFDKVARMLGLPYPGGPEIAKLARKAEKLSEVGLPKVSLPRPMIHSGDFNFSFSGLKTAVLYLLKKLQPENKGVVFDTLDENTKAVIAKEFEDAAIEVLVVKTKKTIEYFKAKTLIVGGGVSANKHLRAELARKLFEKRKTLGSRTSESFSPAVYFPEPWLSTDNAIMIGTAAYLRLLHSKKPPTKKQAAIKAKGNLRL